MPNTDPMVIFQPSGRRGRVPAGTTAMAAARMLGVGIEALCGGEQVCGKCRVRIESGLFPKFGIESDRANAGRWRNAEDEHLTPEDRAEGYRLACAAQISGDLLIYVPEASRPGRQVVSKDARPIDIDCDPAVKTYAVSLHPATLADPTGDLERLLRALGASHGLSGLAIDIQPLRDLQRCVREGRGAITASIWMGKEIVRIQPGRGHRPYGLAIDVGTTTLAAYLCDLQTGELVATASSMNPQIQFGEDVISRINYHLNNDDGLAQLNQTVIEGVNHLVAQALAQAAPSANRGIGAEDIMDVAVCGNTLMQYLLLGLDPEPLGHVPFVPANHAGLSVKARDLGLAVGAAARVYMMPIEAGFVGGDNVGVILIEAPQDSEDTVLIIDIGTNGELIIGNRRRLICSTCSCATGPALEGAQIEFGMRAAPGAIERVRVAAETFDVDYKVVGRKAWRRQSLPMDMQTKGICGSGVLDAVAALFKAGLVAPSGAFVAAAGADRLKANPETGMLAFVIATAEETSIGRDVTISQNDIRQVQLAKAAIYSGCKLLLQRVGLAHPDRIKIAGAFGNHVDPATALAIGMFPDCAIERITSIGNAAGDGCRAVLLSRRNRIEAERIARRVEYVELSRMPNFQDELIAAIDLPHRRDAFPHLTGMLPTGSSHDPDDPIRSGVG
jgi:uncharacterized 2Fe-2S/4Fe-4S cluster protein (DUF4445 family)